MRKVAVTGGLAAGKTVVCHLFQEMGAYVVDADEIVHRLLVPITPIGQELVRLFGADVLNNGVLDRKKIAALVFSQPTLLEALERLIHPAVLKEIDKEYNRAKEQNYPLFVVEIPLLYEIGAEDRFDFVLSVLAPQEICRNRFLLRTQSSSADFDKRMKRQIDPNTKAQRADVVLINDKDIAALTNQVQVLYSQLISKL